MPATAFTVSVPESVPVPEPMDAVTALVALATLNPSASRNSTVGGGLSATPLVTLPGSEVTTIWYTT